ncbi:membrane protein insertase YidC [Blattabacterium cuenoti]|uniref:membrane protein insertase YidC n=1 Tax=Blattabacterium cuenoti TaxID=1653831 RepID=UPI001EEBAC96|nr:membrane protein insertase YidC [Blattabacterium cuenoti]
MKKMEKNLDYNYIIGLFLILLVFSIFTYNLNLNTGVNKNLKKIISNKKSIITLRKDNEGKVEDFVTLENNVLRIKISNIGGIISEVYLKKYKTYDLNSFSHKNKKNLYLVNNSSFLYNITFTKKKKLNTSNLYFIPVFFKKKNEKNCYVTMKAKNPFGKGFLYYNYKIEGENKYDIKFNVKTKDINLYNEFFTIDFEQNLFPLEKDRNWENSYTQVFYSYTKPNYTNSSIKYLSERNSEKKYINNVNWISCKQQFFSTIIIPDKILKNVYIFSENYSSGDFLKKIYIHSYMKNKGLDINFSFSLYFGPIDFKLLKQYKNGFENIIPFGWGFLNYINKYFFLTIFKFLEKTNLNYGIIVILMTIVVKLILSPIIYKQYKLSAVMRIIRPYIEELNNKYKNEEVMVKQRKIMELYKKVGIHPMSGCISALLQIPIFYSLFKFFPTLINLRGKHFLWVDDLTSYDSILKLPFFIPFYGDHVSLLTLLYALALFLYTKFSNNENELSSKNEDFMPKMNFLLYIMPFIMLLFINSYASALSLYYFVSNIINIIFLFLIKKFFLNEEKILEKIQKCNI